MTYKLFTYLMFLMGAGFFVIYWFKGIELKVLELNLVFWGLITLVFALGLMNSDEREELERRIEKLEHGRRKKQVR